MTPTETTAGIGAKSTTVLRVECSECAQDYTYRARNLCNPVDQARVDGWRIGHDGGGKPVAYCPECAGVNEDFWNEIADRGGEPGLTTFASHVVNNLVEATR